MRDEPLDTIRAAVRREIVVQRSRFITTLAPAADRSAADEVIAAVRREMFDARHHCTGMIFGLAGERERSNDDGEPAGTAGAPILAVLRGAGLSDVVAVVTRYFGGVLLGTGGLTRAYSAATAAAVEAAERLPRRRLAVFDVRTDLRDVGRLEHRLRAWAEAAGAEVGEGRYNSEGAAFEVAAPLAAGEALRTMLAASGIGHDLVERGEEVRAVGR